MAKWPMWFGSAEDTNFDFYWYIFWILCVHEIGTFMSNLTVFIYLKVHAIYGSICKNILLLNEFWIIGSFRSHFDQNTDEIFLRISDLAFKKKLNKKSKGTLKFLKIIWLWTFFEARAEILKKFSLVYWSKWWHQKGSRVFCFGESISTF